MAREKEKREAKVSLSTKDKKEQRLMEEHPYETMSQIQNRYGQGRERNGKEGSEKGANRLDH